MARPRPELPEHLAKLRVVTLTDARAAGFSRAQLPGLGLESVHHGVYVHRGTADRLEVRCAAALAALPAGSVISHATVAQLRDLRIPASAKIHRSGNDHGEASAISRRGAGPSSRKRCSP